jgi:hypothetical protein
VNIPSFLQEIRTSGIDIGLNDAKDKLVLDGPERVLTPGILDAIRKLKAELIEYLIPSPAQFMEPAHSQQNQMYQPDGPVDTFVSWRAGEMKITETYEAKDRLAVDVAPSEVMELKELAALADWRYGLKCGLIGQQCFLCRGIPCIGSTIWKVQ